MSTRDWSVGRDFDRIRQHNPLGRVPTLVLDDGEVLAESAVILDYLDDRVGRGARTAAGRRTPRARQALKQMALAIGAAEKGRDQIYERAFRPAEKQHEPWLRTLPRADARRLGRRSSAIARLVPTAVAGRERPEPGRYHGELRIHFSARALRAAAIVQTLCRGWRWSIRRVARRMAAF